MEGQQLEGWVVDGRRVEGGGVQTEELLRGVWPFGV